MDFLDLMRRHNVDYRLPGQHEHARDGWAQVDCVWCSPDWRHFRLGYNLRYKYFTCWSCGHHSLKKTLRALTNLPDAEVMRLIEEIGCDRPEREEKPRGKLTLPKGLGDLRLPHMQYLINRGVDAADWTLWGLKGLVSASLGWRVFVPVHRRGQVVSWTTRKINDQGLRYVSAGTLEESFPRSEWLYGLDFVRHGVVVCEGPFDAVRVGPGAVATLGTAYSRAQMLLLTGFPVRAVCFDNEPAAQARARKLVSELLPFPGKTYLVTLDAKDPGSASSEELSQIRRLFLT